MSAQSCQVLIWKIFKAVESLELRRIILDHQSGLSLPSQVFLEEGGRQRWDADHREVVWRRRQRASEATRSQRMLAAQKLREGAWPCHHLVFDFLVSEKQLWDRNPCCCKPQSLRPCITAALVNPCTSWVRTRLEAEVQIWSVLEAKLGFFLLLLFFLVVVCLFVFLNAVGRSCVTYF